MADEREAAAATAAPREKGWRWPARPRLFRSRLLRSPGRRRGLAIGLGTLLVVTLLASAVEIVSPGWPFRDPNRIDIAALLHDTRDPAYRSRRGAIPTGQPVTLRLRTAGGNASAVALYTWIPTVDGGREGDNALDARKAASGDGYDFWEVMLPAQSAPHQWRYKWQITSRDGASNVWYEDHFDGIGGACAPIGGPGVAYVVGGEDGGTDPNCGFALNVYARGFDVPEWIKHAVIYQIFVDRFYNAVPANDALVQPNRYDGSCAGPDFRATPTGSYLHTDWADEPLMPPHNCDFFGGDLQGVIEKLDYLHGLGVTALYLNPIFFADSNHKYDTVDYLMVDPHFGSLATWHALVAKARSLGMHIILDGVFNHTSSDSLYFDRYGVWRTDGAHESRSSRYYRWYTFTNWPEYTGWFGVDSLPQLAETDEAQRFIFAGDPAFAADAGDAALRAKFGEEPLVIPANGDSVAKYWLAQGAGGWRLDAYEQKSEGWWRAFRAAVKGMDPDAVLIGEYWPDGSEYLLGDQVDGTMNYRFRRAVLDFFARGGTDPDRGHDTGVEATATQFDGQLQGVLEEYPLPAVYASMNLVDSHDVGRILWELGDKPGATDEEIARAKQTLRLIAQFQMTWIGAPTIYYGDEAGQTQTTYGNSKVDPGDRRTFPWGHEDTALLDWYRQWIGVRNAHPALRTGAETTLVADDATRVFAFQRREAGERAVVILNADAPAKAHTVRVPLAGVPDGTRFTDAATHETLTTRGQALMVPVRGQSGRVFFQG